MTSSVVFPVRDAQLGGFCLLAWVINYSLEVSSVNTGWQSLKGMALENSHSRLSVDLIAWLCYKLGLQGENIHVMQAIKRVNWTHDSHLCTPHHSIDMIQRPVTPTPIQSTCHLVWCALMSLHRTQVVSHQELPVFSLDRIFQQLTGLVVRMSDPNGPNDLGSPLILTID